MLAGLKPKSRLIPCSWSEVKFEGSTRACFTGDELGDLISKLWSILEADCLYVERVYNSPHWSQFAPLTVWREAIRTDSNDSSNRRNRNPREQRKEMENDKLQRVFIPVAAPSGPEVSQWCLCGWFDGSVSLWLVICRLSRGQQHGSVCCVVRSVVSSELQNDSLPRSIRKRGTRWRCYH